MFTVQSFTAKLLSIKPLLLFTFLGLFIISCQKEEVEPDPDPKTDDKEITDDNNETTLKVSDFILQDTDGNTVQLSDYEDKTIALFFLGHGCTSCKAIAPSVEEKINQMFKDNDDFVLLGLDTWGGNTSAVSSFKASTNVTFPVLIGGSDIAKEYETTYDRLLIIGKDGDFVYKGTQNVTNDLEEAIAMIKQDLAITEEENPDTSEEKETEETMEEKEKEEEMEKEEEVVMPMLKIEDFTLSESDGTEVTLSDYAGKTIVLFFFGYGCPSCKTVAPQIESGLQVMYGDNEDFVLLGIDTWGGNEASINSFETATGFTAPLLLGGKDISQAYETTYDRLLVVGPEGDFVFKGAKNASSDLDAVKAKVAELLQ